MHGYGLTQLDDTPVRHGLIGFADAVGGSVRKAVAALSALATLGSAIVAIPSLMLDRFSDDADDIWEPFLCDDGLQPIMSGAEPLHKGPAG
jgi:hypothetical protein